MKQLKHLIIPVFGFFSLFGCSLLEESTEVIILLPGRIKEKPIILAETSSEDVSILDIVPGMIVYVWWNDSLIVTENHPMKLRNLFPGDTAEVPNKEITCWYLVHPQTDSVLCISDYLELQTKIRQYGVDPQCVDLLPLRKAQSLREKQLGFSFTVRSIYRYLDQQQENAANNEGNAATCD